MIIIVGIGADGMAGLSEASRHELQRATVIYGSRRQLDLLDDSVAAPRREWPSPMLPALPRLLADHTEDIHIVASGDPLLHGIGGVLSVVIVLLILQIVVVALFGVEPKMRRLEELEAGP